MLWGEVVLCPKGTQSVSVATAKAAAPGVSVTQSTLEIVLRRAEAFTFVVYSPHSDVTISAHVRARESKVLRVMVKAWS